MHLFSPLSHRCLTERRKQHNSIPGCRASGKCLLRGLVMYLFTCSFVCCACIRGWEDYERSQADNKTTMLGLESPVSWHSISCHTWLLGGSAGCLQTATPGSIYFGCLSRHLSAQSSHQGAVWSTDRFLTCPAVQVSASLWHLRGPNVLVARTCTQAQCSSREPSVGKPRRIDVRP